MEQADIGLIGLAVMGQNLVLNMEGKGYTVAVYNRTVERTEEFVSGPAKGRKVVPARTLKDFVASLKKPRRVMVMVKAGPPVDAVIEELSPLLEPGDLIIDGGNSYFKDTIRRERELAEKGILFLGVGVSGGEEGALKGPSIMPGGPEQGWKLAGEILTAISAKVNGEPCCTYLGPDGVGHFVKMVHNGIEYADMQLIAEAYFLMDRMLGMEPAEMSEVFAEWNKGELQSYLIEITADILRRIDEETGRPLVDLILDEAGQKGTGKWTSEEALDLGVPAPTITEAVYARYISAIKAERREAAKRLPGPEQTRRAEKAELLEAIRQALYAAKICSYAQGFAILAKAAERYGWKPDMGAIAKIWRGGCIIRAQFLDRIKEAYDAEPGLPNLMLAPYFRDVLIRSQTGWRRVVSLAAEAGIPAPGFSSALAYYDSYRHERLPANLIQAQRDYFGAHTYQRVDREGIFHTKWV